MTIDEQVKPIMDSYGIPVEIWKPIMLKESSGNPLARAITADEHSIGLFQINVVANPGYLGDNLTDPEVNATIAARDFILPAYRTAQELFPGDQEAQAVYTYKNGIKPYWTPEVQEVFLGYFHDVAGGQGSSLPMSPSQPNPDRGSFGRSGGGLSLDEPVQLGFWDNLGAKVLTSVGILLLLVLGFVSILQLFPDVKTQITEAAKTATKAGV